MPKLQKKESPNKGWTFKKKHVSNKQSSISSIKDNFSRQESYHTILLRDFFSLSIFSGNI